MFGLKEEIIAAACALALLAVAGLMWRLHWLGAEVDRQKANAAVLKSSYDAEHQARAELQREAAWSEWVTAGARKEAADLEQQLKTRKTATRIVYEKDPVARAWRDTPIPADVLASLQRPAGGEPAGDRSADAAAGADRNR